MECLYCGQKVEEGSPAFFWGIANSKGNKLESHGTFCSLECLQTYSAYMLGLSISVFTGDATIENNGSVMMNEDIKGH